MYTWAILLLAVQSGHGVHSSYPHAPAAKPVVLPNGFLADTQEVSAAKIAHLATLAEQSHGYVSEPGYEGTDGDNHEDADLRYHGPTAIPLVLHDGHIADTHEVAAARDEHFAALAKAKSYTHGGEYEGDFSARYGGENQGYSHHVPYHGPFAKPVVLKSGYLADTHEVAAAKQHHLHALHYIH